MDVSAAAIRRNGSSGTIDAWGQDERQTACNCSNQFFVRPLPKEAKRERVLIIAKSFWGFYAAALASSSSASSFWWALRDRIDTIDQVLLLQPLPGSPDVLAAALLLLALALALARWPGVADRRRALPRFRPAYILCGGKGVGLPDQSSTTISDDRLQYLLAASECRDERGGVRTACPISTPVSAASQDDPDRREMDGAPRQSPSEGK